MRDKRIIRIRNPTLRQFRNNLRKLWLSLILNRNYQMKIKQEDLVNHSGGPFFRTKDHVEQYMNLKYSMVEAKRMGNYSICICPICFSHEEDMIWDSFSETWYCVLCHYKIYKIELSGGDKNRISRKKYNDRRHY